MQQVLAIANQKGGVGKTTTAINLASGLAHAGLHVLLIDMDPQGNASASVLGHLIPDGTPTIYNALRGDQRVLDIVQTTDVPRLTLLPSTLDLALGELEFTAQPGNHALLAEHLQPALSAFDYIIIDTPPSLGILTINALAASDQVLVPVSAGVFSLNGVVQLSKTVEQLQRRVRAKVHLLGIVLTMFDRTNVARDARLLLEERFPNLVLHTVIRRNVAIEEAHSRTSDLFSYAPSSTGAADYTQLLKEVLARE